MMKASRSLTSVGDDVMPFALGDGLTVCLARICFTLTIVDISFWHLAGGIAL